MSATNLDLPVLISADQIRRREFVTIRRGYDPDQVRAYMDQLADQVEVMQGLVRESRLEAEAAIRATERPSVDPYEELARRVGGLIREADATAARIVGGAREDAERMTLEARTDADRIRTDAQARAEEERAAAEAAVREARAEADRTIAGLAVRRDALVEQLGSMQERLLAVARDLERTIEIDGPPAPAVDVGAQGATAGPAIEVEEDPSPDADAAPPMTDPVPEVTEPSPTIEVETKGDEPPALVSDPPARVSDPPAEVVLYADVDEVDYEELWAGTQSMRLEVPEIPALDLDWGGEDDDPDGDPHD
ncbi:MAG TPA: DivIVA domain-containing protein [Actinomycetota bacterium]|nr:DivIVA domain-containing protein [Actinomycetota bacterium]